MINEKRAKKSRGISNWDQDNDFENAQAPKRNRKRKRTLRRHLDNWDAGYEVQEIPLKSRTESRKRHSKRNLDLWNNLEELSPYMGPQQDNLQHRKRRTSLWDFYSDVLC